MRQSEGSAVIDNCGKILAGRYDLLKTMHLKFGIVNLKTRLRHI